MENNYNRPLVYLAVPYSHPDRAVRHARFQKANRAAALLMGDGLFVYSPISHSHPIADAGSLPMDFAFWKRYNQTMIDCCHALYILTIDGWSESVGVQAEREYAEEQGIPVVFISPRDERAQIATLNVA